MAEAIKQPGNPPVAETCENCKFRITKGADPGDYHECHRSPPSITNNTWAKVRLDDWCGEWIAYT